MSLAFSLKGKVAVVTGGTGVLGRAMAAGLADAGARVAITGRGLDRTREVAALLSARRAVITGFEMDVRSRESVAACHKAIEAELGPVNILVNGVGGNLPAATTSPTNTFFDLAPEALAEVLDLNLVSGLMVPAQVFARSMSQPGRGGSIINLSSMSADRPLSRVAGYSASKAAVENFTKWLAVHLAQEHGANVRVNAIAPGFFLTDQNRYLLVDETTGERTERGESIIRHTPLARYGEPGDLVGAVVWLASDASRFVTGAVIPVDGGFSAYAGV
jgi:NAD(P)-dependent dehydrogenase (short-subunit alcohol dehydrogenase family)